MQVGCQGVALTMEYNADAPSIQHGSFDSGTSGLNGGSSLITGHTTRGGARRRKDPFNEAYLLSQATSQAMIAARSIVLSGGSQETALCTAKAAANSILVPNIADSDTLAEGGLRFLSRRKSKRQASIVASMALLSVNNSLRNQNLGIPSQPMQQWDATMLVQQSPQQQQTPPQQIITPPQSLPAVGDLTNARNSLLATTTAPPGLLNVSARTSTSDKYSKLLQEDGDPNRTTSLLQGDDVPNQAIFRGEAGRDQPEKGGKPVRRERTKDKKEKELKLIASPACKNLRNRRPSFPTRRPSLPPLPPKTAQAPVMQAARTLAKEVVAAPVSNAIMIERKMKSIAIPIPLSYSSDDGDDSTAGDGSTISTEEAEDGEGATGLQIKIELERMSTDKSFLQQNVDPYLYSLTQAFNCGFSPSNTLAAARKKHLEERLDEDDDTAEDHDHTDEEEDEDDDDAHNEEEHRDAQDIVMMGRARGSESSADSAEVIRELNVGTDDSQDDYYGSKNGRRGRRSASAEEVVLRALSVRGPIKKVPTEEPRSDPITQSRFNRDSEIFTGVHSNPSQSDQSILRVPIDEQEDGPSGLDTTSRKSRFQTFIRNRKKKQGTTAE